MTKGQRAMAVAMIYPEKRQGKKTSLQKNDVSGSSVRKARTVLEVLPELAEQVRDGAVSLNEAYEKAQFERRASETAEKSLQLLGEFAPDLADLVSEERMKFGEAFEAYEQRKEGERNQREAIYAHMKKRGSGQRRQLISQFVGRTGERYQLEHLGELPMAIALNLDAARSSCLPAQKFIARPWVLPEGITGELLLQLLDVAVTAVVAHEL
jgi:hypothetical protein